MARIQGWISKVTIHYVCRWRLALLLHLWASNDTNGTDYAFLLNLGTSNALVFLIPCLKICALGQGFATLYSRALLAL